MKLRDRITSTPTGVKLALMAAAILVASAVPVSAYLAGASGGSDDESVVESRADVVSSDEASSPPSVLRARDIARYDNGSPERTVMEWWQQLQYSHIAKAVEYYDPKLGISTESLSRKLRVARNATGLDLTVLEPLIDDTDINPTEAIVRSYLKFETESRAGDTVTGYDPWVFRLRRVNGEWRLTDNKFVEQALQAARS